jgi:hypothetical protein
VEFLLEHGVAVRAFVLLPAPFLPLEEGVEWTLRSLEYAFGLGVGCCSVIPTRAANGVMEALQQTGRFEPPTRQAIEFVHEAGIGLGRGRVFMDLWEIERFFPCPDCGPARRERLHQMNLRQTVLPPILCDCEREKA